MTTPAIAVNTFLSPVYAKERQTFIDCCLYNILILDLSAIVGEYDCQVLQLGMQINCVDAASKNMYIAEIIEVRQNHILVTYPGWAEKWNEFVVLPTDRVSPLNRDQIIKKLDEQYDLADEIAKLEKAGFAFNRIIFKLRDYAMVDRSRRIKLVEMELEDWSNISSV
jgi:hypothetical protein